MKTLRSDGLEEEREFVEGVENRGFHARWTSLESGTRAIFYFIYLFIFGMDGGV
jgi:hypothetical protein